MIKINAEFVAGAVYGRIRHMGLNPSEYTVQRAWTVLAEMAYTDPDLVASKWYAAHNSSGAGFGREWNRIKKMLGGR